MTFLQCLLNRRLSKDAKAEQLFELHKSMCRMQMTNIRATFMFERQTKGQMQVFSQFQKIPFLVDKKSITTDIIDHVFHVFRDGVTFTGNIISIATNMKKTEQALKSERLSRQ